MLSPSDGVLKDSAATTVIAIPINGEDEDRGHMSDVRLKSYYEIVHVIQITDFGRHIG